MDKNIHKSIIETKTNLKSLSNSKRSYIKAYSNIKRSVDLILDLKHNNLPIIPEINFQSIVNEKISTEQIKNIKDRGCVIIREVFDQALVKDWNEQITDYIINNDYFTKAKEKEGMDQYFSDLKSGAPQIFGLYWSKPQMLARQSESMAITKKFLNSMWDANSPNGKEFDLSLIHI